MTYKKINKDWNNDDGDYSYAINLKPEEFEQDLELEAAGYEMVYWDKANREYTVSNGKIHFTVFDDGNGWCHFLRYYNGDIEELRAKNEEEN